MDEIRKIIREEIALALQALAKGAEARNGYGTGELESAGLQAVTDSAEALARSMGEEVGITCPECSQMPDDHWWKCSRKDQG